MKTNAVDALSDLFALSVKVDAPKRQRNKPIKFKPAAMNIAKKRTNVKDQLDALTVQSLRMKSAPVEQRRAAGAQLLALQRDIVQKAQLAAEKEVAKLAELEARVARIGYEEPVQKYDAMQQGGRKPKSQHKK
jgi:hypothetical protein